MGALRALKLLFRPAGIVIVGVLLILGGIAMFTFGHIATVPERTALMETAGIVNNVKLTWKEGSSTERKISTHYLLEVTTRNGVNETISLPARQLTELQARSMIGQPFSALSKRSNYTNIWELTSAGLVLISYEATRREHIELHAEMTKLDPVVGIQGVILIAIGYFWAARRRKRELRQAERLQHIFAAAEAHARNLTRQSDTC